MAFRITPILGPDVGQRSPEFYWDMVSTAGTPSFPLGTMVKGSDGHDYVYVQASANITDASGSGTQVSLTLPDGTAEAGSGGWYAPPDVAVDEGEYFFARRGALGTI